jgi:hypothetical protein
MAVCREFRATHLPAPTLGTAALPACMRGAKGDRESVVVELSVGL